MINCEQKGTLAINVSVMLTPLTATASVETFPFTGSSLIEATVLAALFATKLNKSLLLLGTKNTRLCEPSAVPPWILILNKG